MFNYTPSILIVDDITADIQILREAVAGLGSVHFATDAQSALALARQCRPDVVLLDVELPGLDGYWVCRSIKRDPNICDTAVIFVTIHQGPEYELKALQHGAVDFLQKPLNLPIIRERVKTHVALRREATRLAHYDSLTQLPNKVLLQDRTEQATRQALEHGHRVAMLLVDMDNFKALNDSLGHAVGDALLKTVAWRLRHAVRPVDTVSRLGGDEFVVLAPEVEDFEFLHRCAENLLEEVGKPYQVGENRYDLTASIGVGVFPDDSQDLSSLYRHAEAAMYKSKERGRFSYGFFCQSIERDIRDRYRLEQQLREALDKKRFEVFYQAKVDVQNRCVNGLEALVRWRDLQGELVSPGEFIPQAEASGLILPIGQFVLRRACEDLMRWRGQGVELKVSVNISAVQFRDNSLLTAIRQVLADTSLPAECLELEITEGVLAQDVELTMGMLLELKQLGVRLSIDDFGTGYSSLAYLKRFPVDVLKIDRSFVTDMLDGPRESAIIDAIIGLAKALGMEAVAEGVELQAEADELLRKGCEVMQGFLYCRPMTFDEMGRFLQRFSLGGAGE